MAHAQHAGLEVDVDLAAEPLEEVEDLARVGDVGHAAQRHRLVGEQGGAEDRQHGVLVGGRDDRAAGERAAAVDDEPWP